MKMCVSLHTDNGLVLFFSRTYPPQLELCINHLESVPRGYYPQKPWQWIFTLRKVNMPYWFRHKPFYSLFFLNLCMYPCHIFTAYDHWKRKLCFGNTNSNTYDISIGFRILERPTVWYFQCKCKLDATSLHFDPSSV